MYTIHNHNIYVGRYCLIQMCMRYGGRDVVFFWELVLQTLSPKLKVFLIVICCVVWIVLERDRVRWKRLWNDVFIAIDLNNKECRAHTPTHSHSHTPQFSHVLSLPQWHTQSDRTAALLKKDVSAPDSTTAEQLLSEHEEVHVYMYICVYIHVHVENKHPHNT